MTDAIKVEASQLELNPPSTIKIGSSTPIEATTRSDNDLLELKRRRIKQLETTYNSELNLGITPPKGSLQSSIGLVTCRE